MIKEAVAVIKEALRARATGPDGQTLVCDMPKGLGDGLRQPSARPRWSRAGSAHGLTG